MASGIMKCFFKTGKLLRMVDINPSQGKVNFNGGIYHFDDKSTFMYEIDAKRNRYMPAAMWTVGNPKAHDFKSVNMGISSDELDDILAPSLLRKLVLISKTDPYKIATVVLQFVALIALAILIIRGI